MAEGFVQEWGAPQWGPGTDAWGGLSRAGQVTTDRGLLAVVYEPLPHRLPVVLDPLDVGFGLLQGLLQGPRGRAEACARVVLLEPLQLPGRGGKAQPRLGRGVPVLCPPPLPNSRTGPGFWGPRPVLPASASPPRGPGPDLAQSSRVTAPLGLNLAPRCGQPSERGSPWGRLAVFNPVTVSTPGREGRQRGESDTPRRGQPAALHMRPSPLHSALDPAASTNLFCFVLVQKEDFTG